MNVPLDDKNRLQKINIRTIRKGIQIIKRNGEVMNMVKVIKSGNAIITIRRPELSGEERERRMQAIHNAAAELIKASIDKEQRKEQVHEA